MPIYIMPGERIKDLYCEAVTMENEAKTDGEREYQRGRIQGIGDLANVLYGPVYCGELIMECDRRGIEH